METDSTQMTTILEFCQRVFALVSAVQTSHGAPTHIVEASEELEPITLEIADRCCVACGREIVLEHGNHIITARGMMCEHCE